MTKLKLLLPVLIVLMMFGAGLTSASARTIPAGIRSEGSTPPPNNCTNSGNEEPVKAIFDSQGLHIGDLHFFYDDGSHSCWNEMWAGVVNILPSTNHYCFTVNLSRIFESGGDSSSESGIDGNNHSICSGQWESSYMVDGEPGSGFLYHANSVITDKYGVGGITTNSATFTA